ncbi:hypothetical protein BFP76_10000 [Amylibacter kogurei]|uniref:Uncharacterized protein n=1 Tax=Paramylibacter kogurei TaxID=1889778 RepID=A0A2G5K2C0_9RHOB|nr:hypothetical protein [Amylibacter kogurei]PIB22854.1 hypothetical protein BFP76_10000 [Amylibacter kogurei]
MPIDISNAMQPGEICPSSAIIFQEVGPRGGKTKHFIALPRGRPLPETKRAGNLWKPRHAQEFQKGFA